MEKESMLITFLMHGDKSRPRFAACMVIYDRKRYEQVVEYIKANVTGPESFGRDKEVDCYPIETVGYYEIETGIAS